MSSLKRCPVWVPPPLHSIQAEAQQSEEERGELRERIAELEEATEKMGYVQLDLQRVESDLAASQDQL